MSARPDIDAIRQRCDEATEGAWRHDRDGIISDVIAHLDGVDMDIVVAEVAKAFSDNHEDAAFIAAARADVPALLDYVERLEKALQQCAFPGEDVCSSGALWLGGQTIIEVRETLGLDIGSGEALS